MAEYRAFKLAESGNIVGQSWCFECRGDDEALEKARIELDGYAVELWAGDRHVGFAVPQASMTTPREARPAAVAAKL